MYDLSNINIGKTLRKYRKIKHLSLEYIGNKIYKSKATVSKYEKGEIIPDFVTVLEICNILDIDLPTLFPSVSPIILKKNSLNFETLYLYYLTDNKLIKSLVKLHKDSNEVQLYDNVKTNLKDFEFYYEGIIDYSDNINYLNLKSIDSKTCFKIFTSQPISDIKTICNCFILYSSQDSTLITKKGFLSVSPLSANQKYKKLLQTSEEDIKNNELLIDM